MLLFISFIINLSFDELNKININVRTLRNYEAFLLKPPTNTKIHHLLHYSQQSLLSSVKLKVLRIGMKFTAVVLK